MSTLGKKVAHPRSPKRGSARSKRATHDIKAAPGNPFAGVENVFGAHSFPPLKGRALKKNLRARILADHNT